MRLARWIDEVPRHAALRMPRGRRWIPAVVVTVVASLIAWRWQGVVARHFCCDMTTYMAMGLDFARNGLFESSHRMMGLRTYGYPYLVGLLSHLTSGTLPSVEFVVFAFQFALFLIVAWAIANIFARALRCSHLGIYALIALNPILLAATPAVLSDLVAALASSLAVALVLDDRRHPAAGACASLLLATYSAMVRPASIAFVPIVLVLWIARGRWQRGVPGRAWPLLIAASGLAFVPQLLNNWRLFHRITPLVTRDLYTLQMKWGLQDLKYATLADGHPITYFNPWYDGSSETIFAWLGSQPLRAIGTACVHLFALFDQDFAVTYVYDLDPWYRWPLCAAGFAYILVGIAALAAILAHSLRRRRMGRIGFAALAVLAAIVAYLLLYLPAAVESRFSQPVYILLAPFVWLGCRSWWRSRGSRAPILLAGAVVPCLVLSYWLAQQAPALR